MQPGVPHPADGLAGDLGTGYTSPVLAGAAPTFVEPADLAAAPGERAPHVWVAVDGRRCSTLDLWDGRLTLVTLDPTWRAAAEDLGLAAPDLTGPRLVSTYHLGDRGAVLVRPDGYVAWRADAPVADPVGALADAVDGALGLTGARANGEFVRLEAANHSFAATTGEPQLTPR